MADMFLVSQSVRDFILEACLLVDDKRGKSEACLDNCITLGLAHCRLLTLIFVLSRCVPV